MLRVPLCKASSSSRCLQLQYGRQLPVADWRNASEWEVSPHVPVLRHAQTPVSSSGVLGLSQQRCGRPARRRLRCRRHRSPGGITPHPTPPSLLSCSPPSPTFPLPPLPLLQAAGQYLMSACGVIAGGDSEGGSQRVRVSYPAWHLHLHDMRVLQPIPPHAADASAGSGVDCSE
jgi:hypothetical protein